MSEVEQRALAHYAERNGLEVKDLEPVVSGGSLGIMVAVDYGGENPLRPGFRYYFPSDSQEILMVPPQVSTIGEFERIYLPDPIRRAVVRVEPQTQIP